MRLESLFQREGGVDNGLDFPGFQKRPHTFTPFLRDSTLECYGAGAQGGTRDRQAAAHDMGRLYRAPPPAQAGADGYPGSACRSVDVAIGVVSCHDIEDN